MCSFVVDLHVYCMIVFSLDSKHLLALRYSIELTDPPPPTLMQAMKKTTSLTSLSMSGSSQGSPIPSHDGGHDVLV